MNAPGSERIASLSAELDRRADELERLERSPLSVELMRGAAASAQTGGIVAALFDGDPLIRGSVPELRLLGALHHLVLSGQAPQLAHHYPSAGGSASPPGAWTAAERALREHRELVAGRIGRTVQTNEPGRCVALFGGLLWLTERHRMSIRLLEIGASAGLNLNADRYRYVVGGATLGDPHGEPIFVEPWLGTPVADPPGCAALLAIGERAGCDPAPIDASSEDGRLALLSYIWPDEPDRLERVRLAAAVAERHPPQVERSGAAQWLRRRLTPAPDGVLTVVWQSVMRQYVDAVEWEAIAASVRAAASTTALAWLMLEPGPDGIDGFELRCWEPSHEQPQLLATGGYHGPPVRWSASASPR